MSLIAFRRGGMSASILSVPCGEPPRDRVETGKIGLRRHFLRQQNDPRLQGRPLLRRIAIDQPLDLGFARISVIRGKGHQETFQS